MKSPPFDQRLARRLVQPLARLPVTPNQITTLTLLLALAGAGLIATGGHGQMNLGAGLFVLARFLDHFDGELARLKGASTRLGYYLDYLAGALSYAALFVAMAFAFRASGLGSYAYVLGGIGAWAALCSMLANLGIDRVLAHHAAHGAESGAVGYPGWAGFELEDGIYLLAPVTWLGWLYPFFVLAGLGAAIYCLWSFRAWFGLRGRSPTLAAGSER